jgi:ribonuclease P protein component
MKRLNSTERLKRRTGFRAAALGARAPGKAFVLQARNRGEDGAPRVGFTVSRQVGNAVERNRVRRRLREIVRLRGSANLYPGHDYVLIGRRAALQLPFDAMMRDLDAALRRVHAAAPAAERGGTGGADQGSLHRAGSPSRTGRRPEQAAEPRTGPGRKPPQQD